jgi:hypothetical protein
MPDERKRPTCGLAFFIAGKGFAAIRRLVSTALQEQHDTILQFALILALIYNWAPILQARHCFITSAQPLYLTSGVPDDAGKRGQLFSCRYRSLGARTRYAASLGIMGRSAISPDSQR